MFLFYSLLTQLYKLNDRVIYQFRRPTTSSGLKFDLYKVVLLKFYIEIMRLLFNHPIHEINIIITVRKGLMTLL